jgi:hypothetical protein
VGPVPTPGLAVQVEVRPAAAVTAADVAAEYALVLAELGEDRCCPGHPAGLTRAEAESAARGANELIALFSAAE